MCVHELPYYFRFHPAALKYLPECILMNTNNLNISLKLIFSITDIYLVKKFLEKKLQDITFLIYIKYLYQFNKFLR